MSCLRIYFPNLAIIRNRLKAYNNVSRPIWFTRPLGTGPNVTFTRSSEMLEFDIINKEVQPKPKSPPRVRKEESLIAAFQSGKSTAIAIVKGTVSTISFALTD